MPKKDIFCLKKQKRLKVNIFLHSILIYKEWLYNDYISTTETSYLLKLITQYRIESYFKSFYSTIINLQKNPKKHFFKINLQNFTKYSIR